MIPRFKSFRPLRFLAGQGMLGVFLLLCLCCTLGTIQQQKPQGEQAAQRVAASILRSPGAAANVVIVANDRQFTETLLQLLAQAEVRVLGTISGKKAEMRRQLEELAGGPTRIDVLATTESERLMVAGVRQEFDSLADARVTFAERYYWPTFLLKGNLLNVVNSDKNVVIAVVAVGMTMVIISGGIDLSVGSLIALSSVVATSLIVCAGGKQATPWMMVLCSLAAIAVSAAAGSFSGVMISACKIPPFIVTLAMMWIASGLAKIISGGDSVADVPESYNWLAGSFHLGAPIPRTLVLMLMIFAAGSLLMSRTTLGRHIYAVGGNRLAARLAGIRVNRVLLAVYTISGAMAGVGGVMLASCYVSGKATYGSMYELYAIAAVVVGGTSVAGGEGRILGTLIGVLIIAVVQNAMNLMGITPYPQQVVLGFILLGVVLFDTIKRKGWRQMLRPE